METKPNHYFKKINEFPLKEIFDVKDVIEVFKKKDEFLSKLNTKVEGRIDEDAHWSGKIFVGEGTIVKHGVTIEGPVYIGRNCTVGPNTHIRKNTIIGDRCEIGKIEIKGSVIMNSVKAHHHGYIGDSIIGDSVNVGAGVVTTNFKLDGSNVKIDGKDTGLRKLGAIIGDDVALGSNATTMPGTVIGPETWIYPSSVVRGVIPEKKILKNKPETELVDKE
jgi:bifunctional UDP-N-acetylglucosamine pyrophosphorylase/glucosamine-1-phosphate N-acetyltransferase